MDAQSHFDNIDRRLWR